MSNLIPVTAETLPLIAWRDQPVITTELLAAVYGASEDSIHQNFKRNRDRFVEGKHYFKLTSSDLREFKDYLENSQLVNIDPRTPSLLLWTERGTVRHAKMLGTDKAWDVQDALEEFYFSRKVAPDSQPAQKAAPGLAFEYVKLIKSDLPGLGQASLQQLYSDASEIDLGRRLIPLPVIAEKTWTATELAEEFGVSANKIGRIANACGLKTAEFGEHRLSKSQYSSKQVEQFHYNKKGRAALALMLAETTEMPS